MRGDPFYDPDWRDFLALVQAPDRRGRFRRYRVFALAVLCAGSAVVGRLCSAGLAIVWREGGQDRQGQSRPRPLYLFAALQRQLGYPEVPRSKPKDDVGSRIEALKVKIRELETRLKLVEGEVQGRVDLSEFLAKPDLLQSPMTRIRSPNA